MRSPFGIFTITCQPFLSSFVTLLLLASLIARCKRKKKGQYSNILAVFREFLLTKHFFKMFHWKNYLTSSKQLLLLVCTFIWNTAFHAHSILKWKIEFLVIKMNLQIFCLPLYSCLLPSNKRKERKKLILFTNIFL